MENQSIVQIKDIKINNYNDRIDNIIKNHEMSKHQYYLSQFAIHLLIRLYSGFAHHIKLNKGHDGKNQLKVIIFLCKLQLIACHLNKDEKNINMSLTETGKQLGNKYFYKSPKALHKLLHKKDIFFKIGFIASIIFGLVFLFTFLYGAIMGNVFMIFYLLGLVVGGLFIVGSVKSWVKYIIRKNNIKLQQLISFLTTKTSLNKGDILRILGQGFYDSRQILRKTPDATYICIDKRHIL